MSGGPGQGRAPAPASGLPLARPCPLDFQPPGRRKHATPHFPGFCALVRALWPLCVTFGGSPAMLAATASITHDDPYQAGRDLAAELSDGLGAQPDVVLLFAAPTYAPQALINGLYHRLDPRVRAVGCTSFAEIGATEALAGSVTALGLRCDTIGAHTLCATRMLGDSFA